MTQPRFDRDAIRHALWPGTSPPARTLACRHCGKKNRVAVPDAVLTPRRCDCGACGKPLFLAADEPLANLASSAYEHPLDARALAAFKAIPGAAALLRAKIAALDERSLRSLCRATCIECGPGQFEPLVASLDAARRMLGIQKPVTLFVGESPFLNAATAGVKEPLVVLQTALVETLDEAGVQAVLGHELGHVHAEHVTYLSLAELLARGVALTDLGSLVTLPLQLALAKWSRCAELTCDRAALLATRDLGAVLSVLVALAGGGRASSSFAGRLDLGAYVAQARKLALAEESSALDGLLGAFHALGQSHPFVAWRVMHLVDWVERGNYLDLLAGDLPAAPA